jgi:hypothetical protein
MGMYELTSQSTTPTITIAMIREMSDMFTPSFFEKDHISWLTEIKSNYNAIAVKKKFN